MKFPTNMSIRITNKLEHDELMRGLQGWIDNLTTFNEDVSTFADLLTRIRYHDDSGIIQDMPEAYIEVSGKKLKQGSFKDMYNLFQQEIINHKATIVLYLRDGIKYRQVQRRNATIS